MDKEGLRMRNPKLKSEQNNHIGDFPKPRQSLTIFGDLSLYVQSRTINIFMTSLLSKTIAAQSKQLLHS